MRAPAMSMFASRLECLEARDKYHADRIAELERQLAEREVDARRYRWLRKQHWNSSNIFVVNDDRTRVRLGTNCPSGSLLDAAIDGALMAQEGKDNG